MRRIPITNISPSVTPGVPATIAVALDYTSILHGKEWLNSGAGSLASRRKPFYEYDTDVETPATLPPAGTVLIVATTFDVVENAKYAGRYTVYTKPNAEGSAGASFSSGTTTIRVNESMPLLGGDSASLLTSGFITNISTYDFTIVGEANSLVLETTFDVARPLEFIGRFHSGWGEVLQQNLIKSTQCFAGPSAPTNPFRGQLWFDTTNGVLKNYPTLGGTWDIVNASYFGGKYRHTQSGTATTWTVTHNLNLASPFVASVDVFIDTAGGPKIAVPTDVTFVSANQLTITFATAEAGVVLVRA